MSAPVLAFAGSRIDRADHVRANPERLAELLTWRARLLQLSGLDPVLTAEALAVPAAARIAAFSQGFFRVDARDAEVRITDLRMGQEPNYVFSFAVAQRASPLQPITPREAGGRGDIDVGRAFHWLWRRAGGSDIDPPR